MKRFKEILVKYKFYFITAFVCLLALLTASVIFGIRYFNDRDDKKDSVESAYGLDSREWMEYAMEIVKETKPTPPESARFYAYVGAVYADVLVESGSQLEAGEATRQIINQIYPDYSDKSTEKFKEIYETDSAKLSKEGEAALNFFVEREKNDGFDALKWDGNIPEFDGVWVSQASLPPLVPVAGDWQRWVVPQDSEFNVPTPPAVGSAEDEAEIQKVKTEVSRLDASRSAQINFWGGVPGTEAPAGIWQNLLYSELTKDSEKYAEYLTNDEYSLIQKNLALGIADSFMECWETKYEFWTARPSQRIPGLETSMPNPNFPSYVSGHSTISRTAAEILSVMIPENKSFWMQSADNAKNSRLHAGIHFDIDNIEGANLGAKIGAAFIENMDSDDLSVEYTMGYKAEVNIKNNDDPSIVNDYNFEIIEQGTLSVQPQAKSHLEPQDGSTGILSLYTDPETGKSFAISSQSTDGISGPNLEVIGNDPIWLPGACSSMPTTLVGGRYIVMFDSGFGFGADREPVGRLLSYDIETNQFTYLLTEEPEFKNRDRIYMSEIYSEGDDKIAYYYIENQFLSTEMVEAYDFEYEEQYINTDGLFLTKRIIDIGSLEYVDLKIPFKENHLENRYTETYMYSNEKGDILLNFYSEDDDILFTVVNDQLKEMEYQMDYKYELIEEFRSSASEYKQDYSEVNTRILNSSGDVIFNEELETYEYPTLLSHDKENLYLKLSWNGVQGQIDTDIMVYNLQNKTARRVFNIKYSEVEVDGDYKYYSPDTYFFLIGMFE